MKKRLKILFKVSGGPDIGLGHIRRSMDLAHFLKKNNGVDIFFHCNKIDRGIIQNVHRIPIFSTPVLMDERRFISGLIMEHNIDVVVIDDVSVDENLCKSIKTSRPNTLIIALDHFEYHNKHLDIIINLLNQNLNISDPRQVFCGHYAEGVKYAIIRDSLVKAYLTKNIPSDSPLKIILTFGGSDIGEHTVEILHLLSKIDLPFNICVIIGPMFKEPEKIIGIAQDLQNCKIFINPKDYEDHIMSADLGFIGGGTTLLEFCYAGVPAIVVPQNVAELRFASFFERNGAVIVLKDEYSENQKIDIIKKMIKHKKLQKKMVAAQKLLIDDKGKERISELILSGAAMYA